MKFNRKALVAAAVVASVSAFNASAFAAADSFSDVPKDHWAYEALDYLASEGIIEGYADGTFQGNRTMTRYEVAAIVAKASMNENVSIGGRSVLDRLRQEYSAEMTSLKERIAKNEADIAELKDNNKVQFSGMFRVQYDKDNRRTDDNGGAADQNDNKRFYLDLRGSYKVNDNWTVRFQNESNRRYGTDTRYGGKVGHADDVWHQGTISRIWVDGYNPNNGSWISIGRSWRGLGMQNLLQGGETDGIQFGIPVKGTGLTASGFWMAPTNWGTEYETVGGKVVERKTGANYNMYGVAMWGAVGHNFDINVAYANIRHGSGNNNGEWLGKHAYVLSAATNVVDNVRLTGDYIRMNHNMDNVAKNEWAAKLQYKGTDLQKKGSFGVYARYLNLGSRGIGGDDEWGSLPKNARTWSVGVKYVLQKNVEWETIYFNSKMKDNDFTRKLFRTQVDFHF